MRISERGLNMIKGFEGYHTALPDGRCIAYRCPAGVLTIGWGCTEGVREGMIWTKDQAEAALRKELAKHEAAVARLVAVDLNDNQRDALISFSYNLGSGALSKSKLLRVLNAGDYGAAQAEFMKWTMHTDPKTGRKKQSRGLAIRRAKEAALFAERTHEEDEVKGEIILPQAAVPPKEPVSDKTKMIAAGTGGVGILEAGKAALSSGPPAGVTQAVESVSAWKGIGNALADVGGAMAAAPVAAALLAALALGAIWFLPMLGGNKS